MITISFYSYKGGVGRSLTLANLGVYLAQFGATVALVDFDLEAPGLHYKLQPDVPIEVDNRGIAGLLADISRGSAPEDLDWDLGIDVSEHARVPASQAGAFEGSTGRLVLIPAGNPMDPGYWQDLADIDWESLFTGGERPGVAGLGYLKHHVETSIEPDVLLVDSRTGITPGGGVATTLLPDVVVTMMLNTAEHLDGSRLVVSAVSGAQRGGSAPPVVVPVLSRYSEPESEEPGPRGPGARARGAFDALSAGETSDSGEDIPLGELWTTLVHVLSEDAKKNVKKPLVLHADPHLQYREYLTFGPYAQTEAGPAAQTLLEDYLRLFATLVPQDTFLRYLTGVRERARGILLDNPDDAVRTLESLATLVGDEAAFIDLVKVYLLRRDTRKLLVAAERLFRVHERVVPHPALTKEIRTLVMGRAPRARLAAEQSLISDAFAEQYWRTVAVDDVEWGACVARLLADHGQLPQAKSLAEELIARSDDARPLADVVRFISLGGPQAEGLAAQLALQYFEAGAELGAFLAAAGYAARYRQDAELAERILDAPASQILPRRMIVQLLTIAGRVEEAGEHFLQELLGIDIDEDDLDEELVQLWKDLSKRIPALRNELSELQPQVVERLELAQEEAEQAELF